MKLRKVLFDRYVGWAQERMFVAADYEIEFDGDHLITITPLRPGLKLDEKVMVCSHNADMYPEEKPSEPAAARALPAKPRAKSQV